ncbi:MAG: hypothetical protein ACXWCG_04465 [Flavitalea sp.]
MKTVISTFSKLAFVMVAFFTMSFTVPTGNPGKSENPAELKYLGSVDSHPRFQLSLNNTESDEFVITIRNRNTEIIYKEKIKGANITRKYLLNTEDYSSEGVTFEVVSKKNKSRIAYTVNETSRLVQDYSITTL